MGVIQEFRRERIKLRVQFFYDAVKVVERAYLIKDGELLGNSKRPTRVEAKKVLMFLCYMNGLPMEQIVELFKENGYSPKYDTFRKGLVELEHKVATENYYHELIYNLYEECLLMESGQKLAEHQ